MLVIYTLFRYLININNYAAYTIINDKYNDIKFVIAKDID